MEHDSLKKEGLLIHLGCINLRDDGKTCNVLVALSVKDKETKKFRLVDRTEPKRWVITGSKEFYWDKKLFIQFRYSQTITPDVDLELSFAVYEADGSSEDLIGYVPAKASSLKMFGNKTGTFQKHHLTHDLSDVANKLSKSKAKLLINVSHTMGAPVVEPPKVSLAPGVCPTCGHSADEMKELQQRLEEEIERHKQTEAINRSLQLQIDLANEKLADAIEQHKKSVTSSQKTLEERTEALTKIQDSMEQQRTSQESGTRVFWKQVQKIVRATEYLRGSLVAKVSSSTSEPLSPSQELQKKKEEELQVALKKATEDFDTVNKDLIQKEVEWREKEKQLQESKDYLHRHAKALKTEMKGLLEEIGSLEEKCAELRAALEDMKKAMSEQGEGNPEVEAYKKKLEEFKVEVEKLKQYRVEADQLKRQLDPLREHLSQLQEDNERLDEKSKRLADELYAARTKLTGTLEDLTDLKSKYEELETQAASKEQAEILKKQYEAEKASLTSQASELKTTIKGLELEIEARKIYLDRTNYELERTVRDCSAQLLKVNKALHEKDKEIETTHVQFKDELAKHATQIAQFQGCVTRVTGQTKDLESSLAGHDERIVKATDEKIPRSNSVQWKDLYRRIKKQEENDLKIKLKETNDQLKEMTGDLETQRQLCLERDFKLAQTRGFLESQSSTMRESIKSLLEEISTLEERCSELRSQLEKQKEELSAHQKGISTDSEKSALQDLAKRLRDDLTEANEEKDELQTRLEETQKELRKIHVELKDSKYHSEKQDRELKTKSSALVELEKEVKDKNRLAEELKISVQEKLKEVVSLVSEKGALSKRLKDLEGSTDVLQTTKEKEITELRRLLEELEKVIEEKEKLIEDLKHFLQEKENELQEKDTELSETKSEFVSKSSAIEEIARELEIKKRLYDEKEMELEETLKTSSGSETPEETSELKASIERLQAANEGMKEKILSIAEDKQAEIRKRDKIIVTANEMLRSLRPWLGLDVLSIKVGKTPIDDVGHFKFKGGGTLENQRSGLAIKDIKAGSAAEKAGLVKTDCIISVNGEATDTSEDFKKAIQRCVPGDVLTFSIRDASENRRTVSFPCGDKHMEIKTIQRLRQISSGRIVDDDYKWISALSSSPALSISSARSVSSTSRIPILETTSNGLPSLPLRVHGFSGREDTASPSFLVSPTLSPTYSPSISPTSSLEGSPTHHRSEALKSTFFPTTTDSPRRASGSSISGLPLRVLPRLGSDTRPDLRISPLVDSTERLTFPTPHATATTTTMSTLSTTMSTPRTRAQSALPPLSSSREEQGTPPLRDRPTQPFQPSSRTPKTPSAASGPITPKSIPTKKGGIPRRGSGSTVLTGLPIPRVHIPKTTSPQAF